MQKSGEISTTTANLAVLNKIVTVKNCAYDVRHSFRVINT